MGDRLNPTGLAGCALILACILAVQVLPLLKQRWTTRQTVKARTAERRP